MFPIYKSYSFANLLFCLFSPSSLFLPFVFQATLMVKPNSFYLPYLFTHPLIYLHYFCVFIIRFFCSFCLFSTWLLLLHLCVYFVVILSLCKTLLGSKREAINNFCVYKNNIWPLKVGRVIVWFCLCLST